MEGYGPDPNKIMSNDGSGLGRPKNIDLDPQHWQIQYSSVTVECGHSPKSTWFLYIYIKEMHLKSPCILTIIFLVWPVKASYQLCPRPNWQKTSAITVTGLLGADG
jgi:hypothetical protein